MATYLITKTSYAYPKTEDKTETVTADQVVFSKNEHGYITSAQFYNRVPSSNPLAYGEELVLMVQSPSRVEKVETSEIASPLVSRLLAAIDRLEKKTA